MMRSVDFLYCDVLWSREQKAWVDWLEDVPWLDAFQILDSLKRLGLEN